MKIGNRKIGPGEPCYIVAELSANHGQRFEQAVALVQAMQVAGADAVKVQTYTADSLTIPSRRDPFVVKGGTLWDGRTLYGLYEEAAMPWDWQPKLQSLAHELGMDFFSSPFDAAAVDFLEGLAIPAYKIASFELIDLPLLRRVAATGKPVVLSTGMAAVEEIDEALATLSAAGSGPVMLLKCTSAYPAPVDEMHLRTIPDMAQRFGVPIGLSDHTPGHTAAVVAVALGACLVEKHFTLSRAMPGPDAAFSMEPAEFREMVDAIRQAEQALGRVNYSVSAKEAASRKLRRSLFIVRDVKAGERLTADNVRCIRPGDGLHPRYLERVLTGRAATDMDAGTPLAWPLISGLDPPARP
ncbi:MAG: pseudaminic acid synthase [Gammaproteobacteria bacterium]